MSGTLQGSNSWIARLYSHSRTYPKTICSSYENCLMEQLVISSEELSLYRGWPQILSEGTEMPVGEPICRYFLLYLGWGETESTWYVGHYLSSVPDDRCVWSSRWNENWQGKTKYMEETSLSATLFTTNPT
jgi:hypothetical protein